MEPTKEEELNNLKLENERLRQAYKYIHASRNNVDKELNDVQQELQAYRDIIRELIYIAEIYKGVMDKDKRPDYDPGSMLTPTIQKARKLIDTVK